MVLFADLLRRAVACRDRDFPLNCFRRVIPLSSTAPTESRRNDPPEKGSTLPSWTQREEQEAPWVASFSSCHPSQGALQHLASLWIAFRHYFPAITNQKWTNCRATLNSKLPSLRPLSFSSLPRTVFCNSHHTDCQSGEVINVLSSCHCIVTYWSQVLSPDSKLK
jgi:hypothetical protein